MWMRVCGVISTTRTSQVFRFPRGPTLRQPQISSRFPQASQTVSAARIRSQLLRFESLGGGVVSLASRVETSPPEHA